MRLMCFSYIKARMKYYDKTNIKKSVQYKWRNRIEKVSYGLNYKSNQYESLLRVGFLEKMEFEVISAVIAI